MENKLYLVVRHKVADYKKWKAVFDESEHLRAEYGMHEGWINRSWQDHNELLVVFRCDCLDRAREFMNLPQLAEWMRRAGVLDRPDIYYCEEFEHVREPLLAGPSRAGRV